MMCKRWNFKGLFRVLSILVLLAFSTATVNAQPDGAALFKANCATCHSLGANKLTGPGLEGVMKRVPSEEWLHKWIKNNLEVIKSGDAYANKIKDFDPSAMNTFEFLKDEEITAIVEYLKNPPKKQEKTATASAADDKAHGTAAEDSSNSFGILISLAILLTILYVVLKNVRKSLTAVVNEKMGRPQEPEYGFVEGIKVWMLSNKKMVAVIILVLIAWGSKAGWDALSGIGIYQGYEPEQPIKFSHKIHAGENGINCVYCHSSAEKGKSAGVPSPNVCMNCHKGIQEGSVTGKDEIAKIYAALDYDPATQKYGNNPKPIKWVRVHNLPDHVYFNHSQHVMVGKVECQTCHGPVQEMDVLKQFSPLTMGWCVNCHRETQVQMEGNNYYTELHKKLAEKYKNEKITVAQMGGIECARCHY